MPFSVLLWLLFTVTASATFGNLVGGGFDVVRCTLHLLQEHDSYTAFRSSGLDMKISLETGVLAGFPNVASTPACLFYNSSMRWFDNLKVCQQPLYLVMCSLRYMLSFFHGKLVLSIVMSTADRHVFRLAAFLQAEDRPVFKGLKSDSTAHSHVCLGRPWSSPV